MEKAKSLAWIMLSTWSSTDWNCCGSSLRVALQEANDSSPVPETLLPLVPWGGDNVQMRNICHPESQESCQRLGALSPDNERQCAAAERLQRAEKNLDRIPKMAVKATTMPRSVMSHG